MERDISILDLHLGKPDVLISPSLLFLSPPNETDRMLCKCMNIDVR